MHFPALEDYLERLQSLAPADARIRLDEAGRAQGRFFQSTLTSAFQAIRPARGGEPTGWEAFARSHAADGEGLCVWRLLDHAASDDESVELDRLCRMLHAINFFRQPQAGRADLYLGVHARLLAAVQDNHGAAFRRVLAALGLPQERIVLQLPVVSREQDWLLICVSDNYRRNGFRIALNASDVAHAQSLLDRVRPQILKIDARALGDEVAARYFLAQATRRGTGIIFKRVETREQMLRIATLCADAGCEAGVQGHAWGLPEATLPGPFPLRARDDLHDAPALAAGAG